MTTPVALERGRRKVFASALEWPGWCRSARSEEQAVEALVAYRERYHGAIGELMDEGAVDDFEVVERLEGNATTDFGAPAIVAAFEYRPTDAVEAARQRAILEACWASFDAVSSTSPQELRKGPRGGGRDRDQIVTHVAKGEAAYARKVGIRGRLDPADLRGALADLLGSPSDGGPLVEKGWPPRYAARRIAWHVLDHAWEIEDKR